MYKVLTVEGNCGNPYNIGAVENHANGMQQNGFELVQVYETRVRTCTSAKSVLIMIFRSRQ
jgi:hypothetical protein